MLKVTNPFSTAEKAISLAPAGGGTIVVWNRFVYEGPFVAGSFLRLSFNIKLLSGGQNFNKDVRTSQLAFSATFRKSHHVSEYMHTHLETNILVSRLVTMI